MGLCEFSASVIITGIGWEKAPIDIIHHDRLSAIRQAADHFSTSGRRRPAIHTAFPTAEQKAETFLHQCARRGMEVSKDSILAIDPDSVLPLSDVCRQTLERRLPIDSDSPFDALLCSSDEAAIVANHHLRRLGLSIPRDVAIIGFNDFLIAPYVDPPLSSIARCDDDVARAVEEVLFQRLDSNVGSVQRRHVPMKLILRDSA
jgi:DNA-binding LacI/PurR family transcriptional regulator